MNKYINEFFKEEEGIETIEFIGLVAVAAVLIGIVVTIGQMMSETAGKAQGTMQNKLGELENFSGANTAH